MVAIRFGKGIAWREKKSQKTERKIFNIECYVPAMIGGMRLGNRSTGCKFNISDFERNTDHCLGGGA
jgi:hypothetical protein